MTRKSLAVSIALVATMSLVSSAAVAASCGNGKLIASEDFKKLNPVWGFSLSDSEKVSEGGYVANFPPNSARDALYSIGFFEDYEICMTVKIETDCGTGEECQNTPYAGLNFWASDSNNRYTFLYSHAYNSFWVSREQNKKFLTTIPSAVVPDGTRVKHDPAPVELSVVVKGKQMTGFVNGIKVTEFEGLPPEGGSLVGFEVGNYDTDKGPSVFTISKFVLRELAQP